jgi:GT2 family glycosyltransferase
LVGRAQDHVTMELPPVVGDIGGEVQDVRERPGPAGAQLPINDAATPPVVPIEEGLRPRASGKFLAVGETKLYVRGVTYGTFRSAEDGRECLDQDVVEQDFAQMAACGVNAVRTYTVPPRWVLDAAQRHGLRVLVGLPWEQHVAFLDDRVRRRSIEARVREGVRACAGHPAVLGYAVGNEIPTSIVRWHGRHRVERFLERLGRAVKAADPGGLVTYVNYPSTEFLDLPFVDFVCFNVYLETPEQLAGYLARLQNVAADRPLILGEIGLDSRRHGEEAQARALDWQVRSAFAAGCAGAFVFAWTDEWHRGGRAIEDWDFGLTDRTRRPKPALAAVRRAFGDVPFPADGPWPRVSVVVCSFNGERTLRDCLDGLQRLEYPDYEVIVVDDGSTDATAAIARDFGIRVISTPNRGLSGARNTGWEAATGEIIAYTDDDARPDPHWLHYLAATFLRTDHAGVGGPNIAPPGDGLVADCVANAPGGPVHVLLSDTVAEHVPGCNMAFRKACLEAVGGFDPRFRAAGDDVDLCWRIQREGWTLGFSPAAMVWHHRRNSVRAYWRQQQGYGKAEALLEAKWPEKYNGAGHLVWAGRLYGKGLTEALRWRRGRVYQGIWGTAPFQSVYQPAAGTLASLPTMPEWYLLVAALAGLAAVGLLWAPLLVAVPLLVLAAGAPAAQAGLSAARARFTSGPTALHDRLTLRGLTAVLHLLQPLARLRGRLRHGLTPWRWRGTSGSALPRPRTVAVWSERWQAADERLRALQATLTGSGAAVRSGGAFDRWDLEVRAGAFGAARARLLAEEHGAGRQLVRVRAWPRPAATGVGVALLFAAGGAGAALSGAWVAGLVLGTAVALLALRIVRECAAATGAVLRALGTIAVESA